MKVRELIEELEKWNLDLEVVLQCDHGQVPFKAQWVGIGRVENLDEYMLDECDDSVEDSVKVVMVEG